MRKLTKEQDKIFKKDKTRISLFRTKDRATALLSCEYCHNEIKLEVNSKKEDDRELRILKIKRSMSIKAIKNGWVLDNDSDILCLACKKKYED